MEIKYHIVRKEIKKQEKIYSYFEDICSKTNNIYNVTNYYIRQLYIGTKKKENKKTLSKNEKEIFDIVNLSLPLLDEISINNIKNKISKLKKTHNEKPEDEIISQKLKQLEEKLLKFKPHSLSKSGFPSYELLDGIFKVTNNVDYRALPAQVAQQTMKKCYSDWKSFFESIKEYNINPSKFTGKPKIPKYKKSGSKFNAVFTNQMSHFSFKDEQCLLSLAFCDEKFSFGKYIKETDVLQQVEVSPFYDRYKISLILKDKDYSKKECKPTRIMGIDLGVNNFATISNNIGINPIIIKGGMLKSRNQYFNKTKACYLSKLQKGKDSNHSQKHSKKLYSLSKNRENFFRDCFYKISHRIIKIALENDIDTIVIGNTIQDMKQNINIGKTNNQNFVSIPFCQFIQILKYLCFKNDIQFIETEESYTSKSSFLDNDILPVYDKSTTNDYHFSGKRISRGLYQSKNGLILNADINGASNIIRKLDMFSFRNLDLSYLSSITVLSYKDFYLNKKTQV